MNTVKVDTSKAYYVLIENGILQDAGIHIQRVSAAKKAVIISDSNVFRHYGKPLQQSLAAHKIDALHFVIAAGEESKNIFTYQNILNFLAENCITKNDILIALGGGVVGDLTGFIAATYLRGIDYVQIPTSLLAMVDSSVGGKTAIDLPAGKNLVGAFHQPILVICDPATLNTLPMNIFQDGCAEVIKYGILYDTNLFAHLKENGIGFDRVAVITRCVELKRDVVCTDEFDQGLRQKLNLGHTIGHGIEKCSQYTVSHGRAVAIGMAMIARASYKLQHCDADTLQSIIDILDLFGLPTQTNISAEALFQSTLSDKKRSANTINLIIPTQIGACSIVPTNISELQSIIKAGF